MAPTQGGAGVGIYHSGASAVGRQIGRKGDPLGRTQVVALFRATAEAVLAAGH